MTSLESVTFTRVELQRVRSRMIDIYTDRYGDNAKLWPASDRALYSVVTRLIIDHIDDREVYTLTPYRGAHGLLFELASWLRDVDAVIA